MEKLFKLTVLSFVVLLTTLSLTQKTKNSIQLTQKWQIDGLSMPESVLSVPNSEWVYISNTNGKNIGFISRVSKSGKLKKLHWVDGIKNPTGMAIYQGKLYVVNGNEIVVINPDTAKVLQYISSTGKMLNDIAVTKNGTFYVGDLLTGQIFTFNEGDFQTKLWLQDDNIKHTNGLLIDGNTLFVGTVGTELKPKLPAKKRGSLYRVNLQDKSVQLIKNSQHLGNFDGVMKLNNGFLTTLSLRGYSYFVNNKNQFIEISQLNSHKITDGSVDKQFFYAPYMFENKVIVYKIEKGK